MEEEKETQNVDDTTPEQSQGTEAKAEENVDGGTSGEVETKTTEPKEEKKEKDFEKGMHKFKDLYKQTRAELESIKQTLTPEPAVETEGYDEAGLKILKDVVQEAISPVLQKIEKVEEETILSDFEKKPYVDILGEKIKEELDLLPTTMPLSERLEYARVNAIAHNIDTVAAAYREVGREEGENTRTLKKGQAGFGGTPHREAPTDDLRERLSQGKVPADEYKERYDEIQKIYQQEAQGL